MIPSTLFLLSYIADSSVAASYFVRHWHVYGAPRERSPKRALRCTIPSSNEAEGKSKSNVLAVVSRLHLHGVLTRGELGRKDELHSSCLFLPLIPAYTSKRSLAALTPSREC